MTAADHIPGSMAQFEPRPQISHIVFDFDGTLSWLRHGWPELMTGLFLRHIPAANASDPKIHDQLLHDILSLNGKSSIYQMERSVQIVSAHGGPSLSPESMLKEYLTALGIEVESRKRRVERSQVPAETFVVYGARALLEGLHNRGLTLIILSGTAQPQVQEEAELLGLAPFFGSHIYGSTSDLLSSSKQAVIERLMKQERIMGEHLLAFGDGPVEIQLTKKAGGLAVGVASDEDQNGSGILHPEKAEQLRNAGADLLIPDYREPARLVKSLIGA